MKSFKKICYALFLDKDDAMDLSQLYFAQMQVLFTVMVVNIGQGRWHLSDSVLDAFLIVYGTTVLLASPVWMAKLLIQRKNNWFARALPVTKSTDVSELAQDGCQSDDPQPESDSHPEPRPPEHWKG